MSTIVDYNESRRLRVSGQEPDVPTDTAPDPTLARTTDVADYLRDRIRRGALAPGQRLVEADIVEATGESRSKVREAFQRLAGEGLIVIKENRGASVRRFGREDIRLIYDIRQALEGLAARILAETITEDQRAELTAIQEAMDRAEHAGDSIDFGVQNERFHRFIVSAANNAYISSFLEQLWIPTFQLSFRRAYTQEFMRRSNATHRLISGAILNRDPNTAEMAMRTHIGGAGNIIQRNDEQWL